MSLLKVSSFMRSAQLRKLYAASRQVLLFSNTNENIGFVSRNHVQRCAYGSSLAFHRSSSKVAAKLQNGEEQTKFSDALPADEFIDSMLSKMENDMKRYNYILKKDIESVIRKIKTSGTVSSIQSLYLLRCGTWLYFETPVQRTAVVMEIWSTLKELDVPMDASHYNALLRSYVDSDYKFSPPEFLAAMEHKGITPNRVTYKHIIEKYCHDGDLSGASAILEHMKEKGIPINESIFNSLVLGHARAKDMKGAVNMMDVMRKSQLEPSFETYTALACGFAENGDMEGFNNTLHEAEEKGILFTDRNYLKMVSSLAVSGNLEEMGEILMKVDIQRSRPDVSSTGVGLVSQSLDDAAFKVMSSLLDNGFHKTVYSFMKAYATRENSLDQVLRFCQRIYDKGLHEPIYEDGVKAMIIYAKPEDTFSFFKEMKSIGRPIRCHYFWPLFASFAKAGNVEGIWAALTCMSDLALPVDADTYLNYVLPHLPTSDPKAVISKIKEIGHSEAGITNALFAYYCENDQLNVAADIYKEYKPAFSFATLAGSLSNIHQQSVEPAVTLLKQLREEVLVSDLNGYDVCANLLNYLVNGRSIPLLASYIQEFNIQGIKLSEGIVKELCSRLKTIAPELVRLVQNLEVNVIRDHHIDDDYVRPSAMSLEELEKHLIHVKETGGNIRPILRHLLTHYCKLKDLNRALEVKAELDSIDFTYSPAAYALLVNLFVSFDKLEEATKYKKLIEEEYPHFKLDAAKAVDYVTLMLKNDKVDDALEIIKNEANDWIRPRYDDLLATSVKKLLNVVADTGNVELTRQLFETFVLNLKFLPLHHTSVEPLIKVHLVRNDTDAAIEEYRNSVVSYNIFPSRNILFKRFITAKDPEQLQKVVDISTTYGGKEIPLHELAAAFIECHCIQEARKVMQTLGPRADTRQLENICYRFFKQEKLMELEQFIGITKDLYSTDRDQLYAHLLNMYVKNNDYQAALEMWNSMQEENVQPGVTTLQTLACLLEKNNQPVPFVIPQVSDLQNTAVLMTCLDSKNEVETVEVLKRMRKGEVHSLSPDTFTRIVDVLIEKKYLKEIVDIVQVMSCILSKPGLILKPVANKYGQAGDVKSMELLYDCFPDFAHRYMYFNSNFFEAHIVSGQEEALLSVLENKIGTEKDLFSPGGFLKLLQKRPDLLDRGVQLANMYSEKADFNVPNMVLWVHYFLQEKYEVAEEFYKKNMDAIVRSDFPFVRIIQGIRNTQNELMGRKFLDVANKVMKSHIKHRAYSCLLSVLVQKGKLTEAVALIEEANGNDVPTEKLFHPTLRNLKNALVERNMPVPFEIPLEDGVPGGSSSDSD